MLRLAAVAAVGVVGYLVFSASEPAPVEGVFSGARFVVSDPRHKFDYALDNVTALGGVMIAVGRQRGVNDGGAVASIHFFDESGAAEFVRTQPPGHCSASFYNAHAKHRLLIPATPKVEQDLKALNFSDHEDTSTWRRFSMSGYCVRGANSIVIDGSPASAPSNMFDNCTTMIATAINVQPGEIVQFSRR